MGLGGATGAQWIVAVVDGPCERPQAGPHANGLDVLAQSSGVAFKLADELANGVAGGCTRI